MLRSAPRASTLKHLQCRCSRPIVNPNSNIAALFQSRLNFSVKNSHTPQPNKKGKSKDSKKDGDSSSLAANAGDDLDAAFEEGLRARKLAADEANPSLDVGPNGLPLFTSTSSLSVHTSADTCSYFKFVPEKLKEVLPEGLPSGMEKEFEESMRTAVLVRQSFLDLRDNFRRIVDPPMWPQPSCKQASSLDDVVETGIDHTHAAVGVVVRLREELSLVKDIPVLFAIDQYNSWFTFSEYEEPVTVRSCRPVHAKELATVNAYRSMMHDDMMVGAFSYSTAVGKLHTELPDVPIDARVMFPRYSLDEAATVCHYYLRQRLINREQFSEEGRKKVYYLSNGNGTEMRWLTPLMR